MLFRSSEKAGFTSGEPWLPLVPGHESVNVAAEEADPISMLWLDRRLVALRRAHPALAIGEVRVVRVEGEVLVFERSYGGERIAVMLNFGSTARALDLPETIGGTVVLAAISGREGEVLGPRPTIAGDDALVILLPPA